MRELKELLNSLREKSQVLKNAHELLNDSKKIKKL